MKKFILAAVLCVIALNVAGATESTRTPLSACENLAKYLPNSSKVTSAVPDAPDAVLPPTGRPLAVPRTLTPTVPC